MTGFCVNLAAVPANYTSPCQAVDDIYIYLVCIYIIYIRRKFESPKTQTYIRKYLAKKKRKLAKKKQKTFGDGMAGVHRTRVPISGSYLKKTAWTLGA